MAPWTPKPPVEKLPLAVRKDARDNFESRKEEFETSFAQILGFPITIDFDLKALAAYANPDSPLIGYLLTGYVEGFQYALQNYISQYGDVGKTYFQNAVVESKLTLNVNELGDKAPTIDADVKEGVFRIMFNHSQFGYNASYLHEAMIRAIDSAPHEGHGLLAKSSIEKEYDEQIEEVQKKIADILNLPDIILDPNFEENHAALLEKKTEQAWQRNFGEATLKYFEEGLLYQLSRQGFKDDEMLQEGFAEGVPSKTIKLRIVDKTKGGLTNEVVLEDGIVYIQTTADLWQYNSSDAGYGIVDLL